MRVRNTSPLLFCVVLAAVSAFAGQDVRGVSYRQQGLKVFEEKCLVCHNRQRIDDAVRDRKDMEKVMRQMEKKGAALTEKDRQVLGHFWQQSPFKGKVGESAGQQERGETFTK